MADRSIILNAWDGILDLVFPPRCLVCGAYGSVDLCETCRSEFAAITPPICDRCGVSTDGAAKLCADCSGGPGWSFERARAAGHFSGPLRQAILRLKYGDRRRLAVPLGRFLGSYLQACPIAPASPDIIVPVPLHRTRSRERGFNQSELLAREVSGILGIPVAENLLFRRRRTRPQAELHASERASNVRDAFDAVESPVLRRASVLLVDDVLTTMHTVDECARVLANAGAATVYVAGVARGS